MKKLQMEAERWSSEALQAMETHLWLLQRASKDRSCGEEEGDEVKRLRLSGQYETDMGPDLDLNSQAPLPHGWEQFLDLRTGQVYYIDWKSCRRSYMDPRKVPLNLKNMKRNGSLLEEEDHHHHHHQLNAMWDFQSEPEISDCISDGSNHVSSLELKKVDNHLITSPLLEEDWDLMELRGWMSFSSDNHSEISSEISSPHNVINEISSQISSPNYLVNESGFLSLKVDSKAKVSDVDMVVMACHHCLSFFMRPKENPWCPNCGDALV